MKKLLILLTLLITIPLYAANYTVKASGGGDYTTIQACATAMAAGDTCTVYAGTYNENVTVPAGTVGNYKTITVNGTDIVKVLSFTLNSHTKLIGNCPDSATWNNCGFTLGNTSSPSGATCVGGTSSMTDVFVVGNVMQACTFMNVSGPTTFLYVQHNTMSYSCSTPASPNVCTAAHIKANNVLWEHNDISHVSDGPYMYGAHIIYRDNLFHDTPASDCGSNSGNCHIDFVQADSNFNGGDPAAQFQVYEKNIAFNVSGSGGAHSAGLFQGEVCTNSGGQCHNAIFRFHTVYGSPNATGLVNDNSEAGCPAWSHVKMYNNDWINISGSSGGGVNNTSYCSTNAAYVNEIYYWPSAVSNTNGYFTVGGGGSSTSPFTVGNNLAYCPGCTTSSIHAHVYGSGSWTDDTGNIFTNPLFVNYVGNNFNLQSSSPARNAGRALTTVNGTVASSTTLTVNDPDYFQDGYSLTGVQGDCIAVTTISNITCITAVNYSTGALTVSPAISATNGDSVWIYSISDGTQVLTDSAAPDLGSVPFNTPAVPPTVTTTVASSITSTTAQSGGTVTSTGGASITDEGVCYATTANPTIPCTHDGTFSPFTSNLSGLTPSTTYNYRAFATNSAGTSYGSNLTFTTLASSGSITPSPTSLSFPNQIISTTSSTMDVVFTNTFSPTATITSLTTTGDFAQVNSCGGIIAGSGGTCTVHVSFTPTALGLRSGSLVLVPSLGGTVTVPLSGTGVAAPVVPTVTTTTATTITTTSAISGGVVTSNGGASVTSEGVCVGLTANPTTSCTNDGTATPFTSHLTSLTSSTTYHYRAYATNSVGTGYGTDMTFTTLTVPVAPTVTTTTASSITATTASAGGVVVANGGASVSDEGTCYGLTANPTSPCTHDGTATPFASSLTGLAQSTTYHYRAFATNSAGTGYGADKTFTTLNTGGSGNTQGTGVGGGHFVIYGNNVVVTICGPPQYVCSNNTNAVAVLPTLPNVGTTTGVNTKVYEYAAPGDFYYPLSGKGNCITRLTDSNSQSNQSIVSTPSGGGNDFVWSIDRSYGAVTSLGGSVLYMSVAYDSNGCMTVNNPVLTAISTGGTQGGFTFSRTVGSRAFHVRANGGGTTLWQEDLSGTSTITITPTQIFDFANCPGVPASAATNGGNGILTVSSDDNIFMTSLNLGASSGQGNAHWVLAWNKTNNQCASYYTGQVLSTENPANGNIWAYCGPGNCSQGGTNPAPLALNTLCAQPGYGIHDTQGFKDGLWTVSSGQCNSFSGSLNFWNIGTNTLNTCHGNDPVNQCGGHASSGFHHENGYYTAFNYRANTSILPFTNFAFINLNVPTPTLDFHGSIQWSGTAEDTNPWMVSTLQSALGACNTRPYCKELMAVRLDGGVIRFLNTFDSMANSQDLGAISTMTQDGYCMIFQSDWNATLGTDAGGKQRVDVFAACNLQ